MKISKYLLCICILGLLLCVSFAQRYFSTEQTIAKKQVAPVKVTERGERPKKFQQALEKQFKAGDRLLMPLGFYSVTDHIHKTNEMRILVENGITVVQKYTAKQATVEESKREIQDAAKAGVSMAFCLPTRYFQEDKEWWRKYILERDLINQNQIAFWYLHGEPKPEDVRHLKTVADLLHEIDGLQRPVISYHHSIDSVAAEMSQFLDCLVFGAYPGASKSEGFPRVRIAHHIDSAHTYGVPVIAALEAYNTPSGWPSPNDIKFDAYLSLIHGVKGIMWYGYHYTRDNPELLDAVLARTRILNGPEYLGEVFLKGEDNPNIQAQIVAGPTIFMDGFHRGMKRDMPGNPSIHWRAYNHRGYIYLVMVNCCEILKKPYSEEDEKALTVKVEFRGFNMDSKVALLDGESEYSYQSELLSVTLKPLGVAVFKVTP
jgi:hypothetical protein